MKASHTQSTSIHRWMNKNPTKVARCQDQEEIKLLYLLDEQDKQKIKDISQK